MMTTGVPSDIEYGVMDLLKMHVPITLLLDLADPFGPHSSELMEHEKAAA